MAEVVLALTTCWRIITAIGKIVDRVEQTRGDGQAFRYLRTQATIFLDLVNQGLAGRDASPYLGTILSLEQLLDEILKASTTYIQMSAPVRFISAARTKQTLLSLDRRLQGFVDTYLIQTATQTRIDLEALSRPIPVSDLSNPPLIPDEARWEVMSSVDRSSTIFSPSGNIRTWRQAVEEESTNPDPHLQSNENGQNGNDVRPVVVPISVQPTGSRPMSVRFPPEESLNPTLKAAEPTRMDMCGQVWKNSTLFGLQLILANVFCLPVRTPICVADCFCSYCGTLKLRMQDIDNHDATGACTSCMVNHFPVCLPEHYISTSSQSVGVHYGHQCARGCRENFCDCCLCCPCSHVTGILRLCGCDSPAFFDFHCNPRPAPPPRRLVRSERSRQTLSATYS